MNGFGLGGVLAVCACAGACLGVDAEPVAERPNVVLILADDLGYADLGFNGCKDIPTPALDKLAASGVKCTAAYASHPYCGPSRAGLMTGRWQQRFGNVINPPFAPADDNVGLAVGEITVADYLKKAGYTTGLIGKWHLGCSVPMHPMSRGFDSFFGFLGGGRDYFPEKYPTEDFVWNNPRKYLAYRLPLHRGRKPISAPKGYLTDILTDEAVSYIGSHAREPFFLYLAYNAPHTPLQAKAEDIEKFSHIDDPKRRTYAAMVSCMDQGVGRVMDALEKNGLRENTLILFASDNGGKLPWSNNGPLQQGKGSSYEGGFRVPLVISWPARLDAGREYGKNVSLLDVSATLLALNGLEADPARPLDGVDLMPYLEGAQSGHPHDRIYAKRYYGADTGETAWGFRHDNMKLVKTRSGDTSMLFDLSTDLGEKSDLRNACPETAELMEKEYRQWESMHVPPPWGWIEEGGYVETRKESMAKSRTAFEGGSAE